MIPRSEILHYSTALRSDMKQWVLQGFTPHFGQKSAGFAADARWQALREAGTEPWLDTGDRDDAVDPALVERPCQLRALGADATDDLGDGARGVVLVARVFPLGAEREEEVALCLQAAALEHGAEHVFGGAR